MIKHRDDAHMHLLFALCGEMAARHSADAFSEVTFMSEEVPLMDAAFEETLPGRHKCKLLAVLSP